MNRSTGMRMGPEPDIALFRLLRDELMLPERDTAELLGLGVGTVDDLRVLTQHGKHRGARLGPLTEAKLEDWLLRVVTAYHGDAPYYSPTRRVDAYNPSSSRNVRTPRPAETYRGPPKLAVGGGGVSDHDVEGYCRWFVARGGHIRHYKVVPPTATCFECREKMGTVPAIALDRMLHHTECAVMHMQRLLMTCKVGLY